MRFRNINWLAQGHAASKWQSQVSDINIAAQKIVPVIFIIILVYKHIKVKCESQPVNCEKV